jgi:Xaa-Pro aminopeptidase
MAARSKRTLLKTPKPRKSQLHLIRIAELQDKMRKEKVDLCLVDHPLDLYYFTGLHLSAGQLFVQRKDAQLFVDGRYLAVAEHEAPIPAALSQESSVLDFLKSSKAKKLIFDSGHCSYDQYLKLQKLIRKLKAPPELKPLSSFFNTLRMIKDPQEVKYMQASAQLLYKGFEHARTLLKLGVSELEVARGFEIFCLENGGEKMAFDPIIAFGANSAMPHHRASNTRLAKGDVVLIDIGVVLNKYHSDMTRMLFFKSIDPFMGTVFEVVRAAQKAALKLAKPGVAVGKLDEAARSVMRRHNMESHFVHSLGHGIGLETHESPRIKFDGDEKGLILEPGMVITIEPGLYYPGKGGVRYEDTIVITEKGHQSFFPEMNKRQLLI